MTDTTARLALPLLQPGQAQKELFHDEALTLLDLAVQPVVEAVGLDTPPADPVPGQAWIVGTAPAGDWAGQPGALAGWTEGGWRFIAAIDGASVWSRADRCRARHDGGAWVVGEARVRHVSVGGVPVLGARAAAVSDPAGGATVDAEARGAVAGILAAMRAHGLIEGG
ncbi:DUF2793 domain-containing protein [uncultured Sphingomonas sp.]|uniref:DUF2793 domain-containing protein n=1 Tax=uncultured Sphingomonas sp. TaxID=158754 RepID=UPI0035CBA1D3